MYMIKKVNKTFITDEDLWIEAKVYCAKNSLEISKFINEAIKEKLKREK